MSGEHRIAAGWEGSELNDCTKKVNNDANFPAAWKSPPGRCARESIQLSLGGLDLGEIGAEITF